MKVRAVTTLAMLTAVALILGYLEQLIVLSPVPGVKLGLANTVLLYALYLLNAKSAWLLMALKVLLSGLLFSGAFSALYSLAGGVLSMLAMLVARRVPGVGVVGVSVCGASAHNLAQLLLACAVAETGAVLSLLPLLLVSAVLAGVITGVAAQTVFRFLAPASKQKRTKPAPPGSGGPTDGPDSLSETKTEVSP